MRTPSSMSCASRTPASPAGENFRPYSTSVPLVSMSSFCFFPAVCFLHRLSAVNYIVSVSLIIFSFPCSLRAVYPAPVELHTHSSSRSCTDIACITRYVTKWALKNFFIFFLKALVSVIVKTCASSFPLQRAMCQTVPPSPAQHLAPSTTAPEHSSLCHIFCFVFPMFFLLSSAPLPLNLPPGSKPLKYKEKN